MFNNKKANMFLGVIIGIFIWVTGILFLPFIIDDIDTTRTDLDCTNTSITDGTKLVCLTTDLVIPYLIWFFVSLAIGFVLGSST